MSTLSCPFCGHSLTDSISPCAGCGKTPSSAASTAGAQAVAPAPRSRLVPWLIGLPVGAFAVLMVVGQLLSTPESSNQWVAREAIKVCNKEVARAPEDRKRPDLTPKDCADLDAAFRSQYGTEP